MYIHCIGCIPLRLMSDKKNKKKLHRKDSQLIIRINSEERDRFVSLCDQLDTSAARELRHFIRKFLEEREPEDD